MRGESTAIHIDTTPDNLGGRLPQRAWVMVASLSWTLSWLILALLVLLAGVSETQAQIAPLVPAIDRLEVRVDTSSYNSIEHMVEVGGRMALAIPLQRSDQTLELRFYPPIFGIGTGELNRLKARSVTGPDYVLLDSIDLVEGRYYRMSIRLTNLARFVTLPITIRLGQGETMRTVEYLLFPFIPTRASLSLRDEEFFVGEERILEVNTINGENIRNDNTWRTVQGVEYRLLAQGDRVRLQIVPTEPGTRDVLIPVPLRRPEVNAIGQVISELPPLAIRVVARSSRTAFLSFDRREIGIELEDPRGNEIQLERTRTIKIGRTYRIETTAEPGGAFVGELYTRSALANDRVLAWIRPFKVHRPTDGYLYIKEGDELRYLANLTIRDRLRVRRVQIMRDGSGNFQDNLTVFPGDRIEVRIEGTGLEDRVLVFDGALDVTRDSATGTDNVCTYRMRIPIDISRRKIIATYNKAPIGLELNVREYQTPRVLDFITVNWGEGARPVNTINSPVLFPKTIREVLIDFNRDKIDEGAILTGKQYLTVEINVFNTNRDLIEVRRIENLVVCPGLASPRFAYYDKSDCREVPINLNQILGHKTYDLPLWGMIEITFRHNPTRHGGQEGFTHRVQIYQERRAHFDLDVSFPAGLLLKRIGEPGYDNLFGISMAVLAQTTFFQPDRINRQRPYRFGAGFIALNAFNFTDAGAANRDLGIVIIGSLFPTRPGGRFSFPIHAGGGYLLARDRFFLVLGPGIQVRL